MYQRLTEHHMDHRKSAIQIQIQNSLTESPPFSITTKALILDQVQLVNYLFEAERDF